MGDFAMTGPILDEDLAGIHAVIAPRQRFSGATVLVTGCAGFLGYYFMEYLVRYAERLGIVKVIGLDTFLLGMPAWLAALAGQFPGTLELLRFDIAREGLEVVPQARDARFVIHMASIAAPTFYRQYPIETIDANIWGLRRLFEFYRGSESLQGILYFSSSEIYGDPDPAHIPSDEEYRGNVSCTGPRACYDESKRFGETLCMTFAKKYSMPITVARPFNNYGPGMRLGDKRLPADFASAVLSKEDLVILSDGTPTRTFCYVSDAIMGYLLCLLHGKYDYFNIGMDRPEISVRELAEIFRKAGHELIGYEGNAVFQTSSESDYLVDNPNRRRPVIEKARTSDRL